MPKYRVNRKCFGFKGKLYEEGEIVEVAGGETPPKFFTPIEVVVASRPAAPAASDPVASPEKEPAGQPAQDPAIPPAVDPLVPPAPAGKVKGSTAKAKGSTGKAKAK